MTSLFNSKKPEKSPPAVLNDQFNKNHTDSTNDIPTTYERHFAYAAEIKFIIDRYITPVTVEFGSSESNNLVNIPVKHHKLFATLKILDPFISITINDTAFNYPGEFPMGTGYTENFDVIVNKEPHCPRFFVHHDIYSKIKLTALKFEDHDIMSTLQFLNKHMAKPQPCSNSS